jgi:hypothetical protein
MSDPLAMEAMYGQNFRPNPGQAELYGTVFLLKNTRGFSIQQRDKFSKFSRS